MIKINNKHQNATLPQTVENIARWHNERNLIDGTTSYKQTEKLLEEFTELVSAQLARDTGLKPSAEYVYDETRSMLDRLFEAGRIKGIEPEHAEDELQDAIGDMIVVQTNIAEREGFTISDAAFNAYLEIKDRKGKMIDGTFVKEADL